ncbi:outer membrane biogenesis protein BamB [Rosistilla carotiformis]|uniref:Outer membrane biogenesis protein BamB n=1 Tax=Rosistilla carotiformis TaxID=2528017 RepID=A0A518JXE0_9BACT|nr:PQQ-binding-like beta-propeller repeat protein [Rosistilla carotiformis]QDV70213.1 outer membrane biogenesis protein BamB [Rosistilla carotiformis]
MKYAFCLVLTTLAGCLLSPAVNWAADLPAERQWSEFRGPSGNGHSPDTNVPVKWDARSLRWQTDLPARGHSSPVMWGDKVFLSGAVANGSIAERHMFCVDRSTGKLIWDTPVATGKGEQIHKMNSWGTPSCATDGTCVVAFFGPGGLHCLDMNGKPLWSRELGSFPGVWGIGASPIFVGDTIVQNCDAEGASYLVAVDKLTGQDRWRQPRADTPRGGWSTPVLSVTPQGTELLLNGEFGIDAYNPETGQPLWNCRGFNGRGTPMPVVGNGLVYVVNGKAGDVYAVRSGGRGDVTQSHMAWNTPRRGGRDLPSPILVGDTLVVFGMAGVVTGYDAHDGTELFKERLGGNYSGSPILVDGLVYALTETGEVNVLKIGRTMELVSRNRIPVDDDEIFRSSPTTAEGMLLIRSDRRLYCIGNP